MSTQQEHWDRIYASKQPHEVSWTQAIPQTSLELIHRLGADKSASVIDVGGGDSKLVDFLLEAGYVNLTVLDISANAIARAQHRLGDRAGQVNWIVSDILDFHPDRQYDIWHDRATFHFLTDPAQAETYLQMAGKAVKKYLVLGTFSENGPEKCSGLPVRRYSAAELENLLSEFGFEKIQCLAVTHTTPALVSQDFLFCSFKRRE